MNGGSLTRYKALVVLLTAFLLTISFASAAFALGYNWSQFHYNEARTGYSPNEVFTTPLVFKDPWTHPSVHATWLSPVVVNVNTGVTTQGVVFAKLVNGYLDAFDSTTGANIWSFYLGSATDMLGIWGFPPAVAGGVVYVGSASLYSGYAGKFYALDASDGSVIWEKNITNSNGRFLSSPLYYKGTVYAVATNGYLYAIDATNGSVRWSKFLSLAFSSPAAAEVGGNDRIFIGSMNGLLYSLDTSGNVKWSYATGGVIHSTPVIDGNTVYIGSYDKKLHAVNASTGAGKWTYTTGGSIFATPAVADGVVYVGSKDGTLYAIRDDGTSGTLLWSYSTPYYIYSSPAVVVHSDGTKTIFFGSNKFYGVDGDSGTLKWSYTPGGAVRSSPAIYNKTVYIANPETIYAFEDAGTIQGYVYEDLNANGQRDVGEPGISGVNVYIRDKSNSQTVATLTTDGSGFYTINVGAGEGVKDYVVVEGTPPQGEDPAGYYSSTPNVVLATVVNGQVTEVNFGDTKGLVDTIPPVTEIELNPASPNGENGWYVSDVEAALSATDNPGGSGVEKIEFSLDEGATWCQYNGPFKLSQEGEITILARATDKAGNVEEPPASVSLKIDQSPPLISLNTVVREYTQDEMLTIDFDVVDLVSGLDSYQAYFGSAPVENGTTIDLFYLSLGSYSLSILAEDKAGNTALLETSFEIVATPESLSAVVDRSFEEGLIDNQGVYRSLKSKCEKIIQAAEKDKLKLFQNLLKALQNEVEAQKGKHIDDWAAELFLEDIQYLLDSI
jgi:outer membrane protein assembly factor BamB